MATTQTQPGSWWKEELAKGWHNVKDALRRDWEQTKHDLHLGGRELRQDVTDTVEQAVAQAPVPAADRPNFPSWEAVESPMRYGYAARTLHGQRYPQWNSELEAILESEWPAARGASKIAWRDVKEHVRRGYEYRPRQGGSA
jgi:hypothetical protein